MPLPANAVLLRQGAEAKVYRADFCGREAIAKLRFPKTYRHPDLDRKLTTRRLVQESRLLLRCLRAGVTVPGVWWVDMDEGTLYMEYVDGDSLRDVIFADPKAAHTELCERVGRALAGMHATGIVHGDLTTSNLLCRRADGEPVIIDFGLGSTTVMAEDRAVDLYVLERAFISTHPGSEQMFQTILDAYLEASPKFGKATLHKLEDVRMRGRKRSMVG